MWRSDEQHCVGIEIDCDSCKIVDNAQSSFGALGACAHFAHYHLASTALIAVTMHHPQMTIAWLGADSNQQPFFVEETKTCTICKHALPLHAFPKHSSHKDNLDSRCRHCIKKQAKIRNNLKKLHPKPPPGPCPICGEHTVAWRLDHCHKTNTFRACCTTAGSSLNLPRAVLQPSHRKPLKVSVLWQ